VAKKRRFPWAQLWVGLCSVVALGLAAMFVLRYLRVL
jgi:hypothetical protein